MTSKPLALCIPHFTGGGVGLCVVVDFVVGLAVVLVVVGLVVVLIGEDFLQHTSISFLQVVILLSISI